MAGVIVGVIEFRVAKAKKKMKVGWEVDEVKEAVVCACDKSVEDIKIVHRNPVLTQFTPKSWTKGSLFQNILALTGDQQFKHLLEIIWLNPDTYAFDD